MNKEEHPHRPNTMRLPGANYSDPGIYFLTLCSANREPLFGKIVNSEMVTNQFGSIVWEVWKGLPKRYPQISIDTAIVMPNHFHGIVIIHEKSVEITDEHPIERGERRKMTIPLIVGYLKMTSSKMINQIRNSPGVAVWQRGYFDRILRDDTDYDELSEYIFTNPQRWGIDKD